MAVFDPAQIWGEKEAIMTNASKLSVMRCAASSAAALSAVFVLCWLAAALFGPIGSHMFVTMFTPAPPESFVALGAGLCWSIVFGAAAGGLFAAFYNWFGHWQRP